MSENPFQSPTEFNQPMKPLGGDGGFAGLHIVNQIQVIAILMLVQGALLLVMSMVMFFYAFGFVAIIRSAPADQGGPPFPEEALFWIQVVGVLGGGFFLLLALMHFLSGYWGLNLKGRMFGITTMILGLASSLTFYCAPTAIGLAVYGLIIYFHQASRQAFEMSNQGKTRNEILKQFY